MRTDVTCRHLKGENTSTHVGKTGWSQIRSHGMKKHPHTCGEDPASVSSTASCRETPPRMWGRRYLRCRCSLFAGNTPTHVGKTQGKSCLLFYASETPPHMWGRQKWRSPYWRRLRNTPTHVGKANVRWATNLIERKHPHAYGEDSPSFAVLALAGETPPRMWGRDVLITDGSGNTRNTPTHVGKRCELTGSIHRSKKHPHACGEDPLQAPVFW